MEIRNGVFSLSMVLALAFCLPPCSLASFVVSAGSGSVPVGGTLLVPVSIDQGADLYAYQFDLAYDPSILQLESILEGPLLPSVGSTVFSPGTIDNATGIATFIADSLVGPIPGASSGGDLADFRFVGIGPGTSSLTLSNVVLLDSALNDISFTTSNGSLVVTGSAVPEPRLPWVGLLPIFWVLLKVRSGSRKS
jgi:general secretion pathway protein D